MLLIFFEPIISFFLKSKKKNANLQKDPVFLLIFAKKSSLFYRGMFSFPWSSGFRGWYVQFSTKFRIPGVICSVFHEVPDSGADMFSFSWGSRYQGWYGQFPMRFRIPRVVFSVSNEVPDSKGGMFIVQFPIRFPIPGVVYLISYDVPDSRGGIFNFLWCSGFQGRYI